LEKKREQQEKHREAKKQKQKQQKQPNIRSEKENAKKISTQKFIHPTLTRQF